MVKKYNDSENKGCTFTDDDGNEITKCIICNKEISPHNFTLEDTCYGDRYCVQILKCKDCGALSFGWTIIKEVEDND